MLRIGRYLPALLFAAFACAKRTYPEFRGRWTASDGVSFQACGSAEKWFVTFGPEIRVDTSMVFTDARPGATPSPSVAQSPSPILFGVVRGDTSAVGAYGPTGQYRRHLTVHDILRLDTLRAGDCS